jgi:hypothetical protein
LFGVNFSPLLESLAALKWSMRSEDCSVLGRVEYKRCRDIPMIF